MFATLYQLFADLFPWKSTTGSESNGDSRVKMCAGDVANGVNHDHNGKPPNDTNAGECDSTLAKVHRHRSTAGEYQKISTENLGNYLPQVNRQKQQKLSFKTSSRIT